MSRFHSQLNGDEFGTVIGDQETFGAEREFWFRASDIFGPEHFFGLGFGTYSFPTTRLTELRSDGEVVDFDFRFQVQYQIFKYDFSRRLSRSWDYEVGGGFGFLFGSGIRVSGYKVKGTNARTYGGRHVPDYGNLWRLGVGLKRPVSDHLVLRFGLRLTHLYYGNLRGRLNELESSYYFTRDGGLTIVSALEAAEAAVTYNDPLFGVVTAAAVRSRAWVSEGRTELYGSIGVRF